MKRKTTHGFIFVIVAVVAALFLHAPRLYAQAQENCLSFHVLIQADLSVPELLLREGDVWGGYAHGYLGLEPLHGRYSGNNGETLVHGRVGMGSGSDYFDFGGGNTLTAVESHATFPSPPGLWPLGAGGLYRAADKIAAGTGRFQNASGNLSFSGPFVVWDLDKEIPQGRWAGEVVGNICGVQ